jgi:hypothetical protein
MNTDIIKEENQSRCFILKTIRTVCVIHVIHVICEICVICGLKSISPDNKIFIYEC